MADLEARLFSAELKSRESAARLYPPPCMREPVHLMHAPYFPIQTDTVLSADVKMSFRSRLRNALHRPVLLHRFPIACHCSSVLDHVARSGNIGGCAWPNSATSYAAARPFVRYLAHGLRVSVTNPCHEFTVKFKICPALTSKKPPDVLCVSVVGVDFRCSRYFSNMPIEFRAYFLLKLNTCTAAPGRGQPTQHCQSIAAHILVRSSIRGRGD